MPIDAAQPFIGKECAGTTRERAVVEGRLEQLQDDDMVKQVVEARAAELLGGSVRVQFSAGSGVETGSSVVEEDVVPNKDQLLEAPTSANDPDALVEGLLGGQVIEEIVDED